jgi:hypothetical protein
VVVKRTLLLALALALAAATPTAAARLPPPSALVARPAELPGFAYAEFETRSATSPASFAGHVLRLKGAALARERALLAHEGLREGVEEGFGTFYAGGVSDGLLFRSARGALEELAGSVTGQLVVARGWGQPSRFAVAAIPGSHGFTASNTTYTRRYADVMFSTGRCFVLVGDAREGATSEAEVTRAPIAATAALYRRVRRLCA